MYEIKLTLQEAQALINLLDIAVKSTGFQVAEAAVALAKKIQDGKVEEPDVRPTAE